MFCCLSPCHPKYRDRALRIHISGPEFLWSKYWRRKTGIGYKTRTGVSHHVHQMDQSQHLSEMCAQILSNGFWEISALMLIIGSGKVIGNKTENLLWLFKSNTNQNHLFKYFPFYSSEKAMAPHSSTLAWKIPWMEEPGRLQSMGSLGVGHDWATSPSLFTFMHWRGKWQPTPVFLPGESQGQGSLVGCRLWGQSQTWLKRLSSSSIL